MVFKGMEQRGISRVCFYYFGSLSLYQYPVVVFRSFLSDFIFFDSEVRITLDIYISGTLFTLQHKQLVTHQPLTNLNHGRLIHLFRLHQQTN